IKTYNHFNYLRVKNDTFWIKVSRRSIPVFSNGIRIFMADNQNVKNITTDNNIHSLLQKDALICLSDANKPLLSEKDYCFPVSYNDGFFWKMEEDSHMFSYLGLTEWKGKSYYRSHEGIDINLHDARGIEKHLLVAVEDSRVVWVENKNLDEAGKEACILLESSSQPGIYYVYKHLYNKKVFVKKGDELVCGEPIGAIWGDQIWGHLHFAIVKSDTIPTYEKRYNGLINFFPHLHELYYNESFAINRYFSKGRIKFGQQRDINGNEKNNLAYESYVGKGWKLGMWNIADKLEWCAKGNQGNVRLSKILFKNEKARRKNPENWYDYEINVRNGNYRIRANIGDLEKPTWQKVSFEGLPTSTYTLKAGEFKWTAERVVKVTDGKLTVRIYIDENGNKYAGISEIVFQQAF
ncbi:MAG: M23 family metallopeptidase, partial [Draconibacterium sp.]|nr:M23 family metallopeptidase [Draconibacterium sp.]